MASRYSIILSFFLATLLAVGGVELFYGSLIQTLKEKAPSISQPDTTKNSRLKKSSKTALTNRRPKKPGGKEDYSSISRRSLFGKDEPKKSIKAVVKEEPVLKTTSLNLTLLGTVSGDDNDQRAIILNKNNKKQDIFYKGDSINNALIKEILKSKIILTINGKDEVLLMEESKSPASTGNAANYAMPDVLAPPRSHMEETEQFEENTEEFIDENLEENEEPEDIPPAATPKRRMTLKPKQQQVTEP